MSNLSYTPPEITSIMGVVDTYIRWQQLQQAGSRSYKSYHPSEWGHCLRRQQYKHYAELGKVKLEAEPESFNSQKLRLFDTGHSMHERWSEWYFSKIGVLRGRWKCTNPFCHAWDDNGSPVKNELQIADHKKSRVYGKDDKLGVFKPEKCICNNSDFKYIEIPVVEKELNMVGHADMILDFSKLSVEQFDGVRSTFNLEVLPKSPIVVDMKTCGSWPWKKQVMKLGPYASHIIQITIYVHILGCEYGVLIYECKDDSSAQAFRVNRNDELFDTICWQAKMMQRMAEKDMLPPPRPTDKSDNDCRQCEFSSHCHNCGIWEDPEIEVKRRKFYKNLLD